MVWLHHGGGLPAGHGPAYTHGPGVGLPLVVVQIPDHRRETRGHLCNGYDPRQGGLQRAQGCLGAGAFGRAGGDEHTADILQRQTGLFRRQALAPAGGDLHGRAVVEQVRQKRGKPDAHHPQDHWTGGGDDRVGDAPGTQLPVDHGAHSLRRFRHLKYLVKANPAEPLQNRRTGMDAGKLTVERRGRQGNGVFVLAQHLV